MRVFLVRHTSMRSWWASGTVLAAVLLVVLLCIYFASAILGGAVLTPADMIFQFPFFKEAAPAGFQHASNSLLSDAVLKFYPWHTVTREALENGQFPFWNPYAYCGTPHFANAESAVLYPINLLGYLFPLNAALTFSAVLRMFVAGAGTFLFLRAIKVGKFGALVAAVTFMLGGSMTVWLNYPVGNAYAWMPMLFFLGEQVLSSRNLVYVPLTGMVIAVQISGGHYQTSFIMLVAWWLYLTYRVIQAVRECGDRRQTARTFLLLGSAVVLGFMLVAVQLLPFWVWLRQTSETRMRLEELASSWIDPSFWKHVVVALVTLVLPNFFGNPTWGSPDSFFFSNYIEQMVYMGIVPLTLVIVAMLRVRHTTDQPREQQVAWSESEASRRSLVLFLASLGVVFLGIALRLPGIDLVNRLPVFNIVAANRYRLVFTFCLAVLSGIGAERIFRLPLSAPVFRYLLWGLLAFAGMGAFLLSAVHWGLVYFKDALMAYGRVRTLYPIMVEAFSLSSVSMYFPILVALAFAGVLALYRKRLISPRWSMALSLGLVLVDLYAFGVNFNPAIPSSQVFPVTDAVRFLQDRFAGQDPARIVALNDDLPPNTGTPYRFSEIAGSDYPSRRYLELAQAAGGKVIGHNRISFSALQPQLVNLMNVRYLIASVEPTGLSSGQLREVYRNSFVRIYENLRYLPRAYVVHQVKIVSDGAQILQTLTSLSFDPGSQVIIEEVPPVELPENTSALADRVQIVRYQSQQVDIRAELAENGFLFLSDAYYPGWRAFVNGEETKIYRANYAFRTVYLPAGEHVVKFVYTPAGFKAGLAVTAAGLVLILALFVAAGWQARRRRETLQRSA